MTVTILSRRDERNVARHFPDASLVPVDGGVSVQHNGREVLTIPAESVVSVMIHVGDWPVGDAEL